MTWLHVIHSALGTTWHPMTRLPTSARPWREVLASFRDALRAFEGSHPFHNYTRRSQYSATKTSERDARRDSRKAAAGEEETAEEAEEEEGGEGEAQVGSLPCTIWTLCSPVSLASMIYLASNDCI